LFPALRTFPHRRKNREYRRLVQKIIFFSIKAKRKVESLSAQFKKAQEKYNRYSKKLIF
jgi:hypothetical protein